MFGMPDRLNTKESGQERGVDVSLPQVVSREEWLRARKELLVKEKEPTRQRDTLNAERRRLPMVKIEKDYVFEDPDGKAGLLDLFEGRLQLIVSHFMFDPSWEDGCSSCSAGADEMSTGLLEHLHVRDTSLVYVSRAPLHKLERYKASKGWSFPWYSSYGSYFNYDFHVTMDDSVTPVEYNYRTRAEHEQAGTSHYVEGDQPIEEPGTSFFFRNGDDVFHTYSMYASRCRDDRRFLLLPRPHRARPAGGVGGAEGPRLRRTGLSARLLKLSGPIWLSPCLLRGLTGGSRPQVLQCIRPPRPPAFRVPLQFERRNRKPETFGPLSGSKV